MVVIRIRDDDDGINHMWEVTAEDAIKMASCLEKAGRHIQYEEDKANVQTIDIVKGRRL